MTAYFDTGIILKLYTEEPESEAVRAFVIKRGEAIGVSTLHLAECVSALRLKQFRGEGKAAQVSQAIANLDHDVRSRVLKIFPVDWDEAWRESRALSDAHAGVAGCRTLDALHVACARLLGARQFISSDRRQGALAKLAGLKLLNPCL